MTDLKHSSACDTKPLNTTGLPDGAIAEFTAVLSTSKLDRDGDKMFSGGATVDPAMPLLWQHNPDLPIGKLAEVVEQNDERIVARFHLADLPLAKDALVLLKLGGASHFSRLQAERRQSPRWRVRRSQVARRRGVSRLRARERRGRGARTPRGQAASPRSREDHQVPFQRELSVNRRENPGG